MENKKGKGGNQGAGGGNIEHYKDIDNASQQI